MPLRQAQFKEFALKRLRSKTRLNNAAFKAKTPGVKPHETTMFASEEDAILAYLRDKTPAWINMWTMLNYLSKREATYWIVSRPNRQRLLATLIRLISERRVLYVWRDRSLLISPSEPSSPGCCSTGPCTPQSARSDSAT